MSHSSPDKKCWDPDHPDPVFHETGDGRGADSSSLGVDIVVPVHNEAEMTGQFLESLREYTGHPFRLILVDNGSRDLPRSLIDGFPGALWVRLAENLGFAGGCNAGIRAGRNPLVLVVNNDLILTRGWLTRLVHALTRNENVAAVAACSNYSIEDQQVDIGPFWDEESMHLKAGAFAKRHARLIEDVPFASGMCLLLRREVLDRTGLFDERFGPGNFEDNDLCLRIKNLGLRVVVARDVFVYHLGNRTFRQLRIDYKRQIERNQRIFRKKWSDDAYVQGSCLENEGALDEALRNYLEAMKNGSTNPEPLFRTGFILLSLGQFETARNCFLKYIDRCPDSTRARLGLGCAMLLGGRVREGRSLIQALFSQRYVREGLKKNIQKMIHSVSPVPCKEHAGL
jgi:GT2 family glycosyltransferase